MDELENRLRRALERVEPPAGFADRAIARARAQGPRSQWLAAAAAVFVLVGASYAYRWHEGQTAKRQVLLALRITSAKLTHIQAQVAR
jgi:hypothetical protein